MHLRALLLISLLIRTDRELMPILAILNLNVHEI